MKFKALVLACAILAGNASASVLIDFEGVGNGASVNDYYNGGTDSQGNTGINYGIRFTGGTVLHDALGAYLRGPFTLTYDTPPVAPNLSTDYYGLSFLATRWDIDGGHSWAYKDSQLLDAMNWIAGTANPYCRTKEECDQKGYIYIPPTSLFGYFTGIPIEANRLVFNLDAADDLLFGAAFTREFIRRDLPVIGAEVPEPSSIALLGLGALGLLGARRRKSANSKNA